MTSSPVIFLNGTEISGQDLERHRGASLRNLPEFLSAPRGSRSRSASAVSWTLGPRFQYVESFDLSYRSNAASYGNTSDLPRRRPCGGHGYRLHQSPGHHPGCQRARRLKQLSGAALDVAASPCRHSCSGEQLPGDLAKLGFASTFCQGRCAGAPRHRLLGGNHVVIARVPG